MVETQLSLALELCSECHERPPIRRLSRCAGCIRSTIARARQRAREREAMELAGIRSEGDQWPSTDGCE